MSEDSEESNNSSLSFESIVTEDEQTEVDSSLFESVLEVAVSEDSAEIEFTFLDGPKITLYDSGHIFLVELTCTVVPEESAEALLAEEEKERYLKIKSTARVTGTKDSQLSRPRCITAATSNPLPPTNEFGTGVTPHQLYDDLLENPPPPVSTKQWTIMVTERLLSQNLYSPLEKRIGVFKMDPLDLNITFTYEPLVMNILKCEELATYKVACITKNPKIPYLFAVGFYKAVAGCVAIWCIKNLMTPERIYRFSVPVTCVQFSEESPNLLAVGFNGGDVRILDTSSVHLKVIYTVPYYGAHLVAAMHWWKFADGEGLAVAAGNSLYTIKRPFISAKVQTVIQTTYVTSKVGIFVRQNLTSFPLSIGPMIRGFLRSLTQPDFYLVGDAEGDLRLCNLHSSTEFFDIYAAHIGVINTIKRSPYHDKLFLTCGSDGCAQVWCFFVKEPLLVLESAQHDVNVRDVAWSPRNATVIVGIANNQLWVWDFCRKLHEPVTTTELPRTPHCLEFSSDGSYLLVGTGQGDVLVIALKHMPFPEYNHRACIMHSIRRWLHYYQKFDLKDEFEAVLRLKK